MYIGGVFGPVYRISAEDTTKKHTRASAFWARDMGEAEGLFQEFEEADDVICIEIAVGVEVNG